MKKRIIKVITVSASLVFVGCAYAFLNVNLDFSIPCIFKLITGLECPGCGVTRMCISLLKLDFKSAFQYNPVIFCMLPIGAVMFINGIRRYILCGVNKISKAENNLMILMIIVLVIYGIIRNIA